MLNRFLELLTNSLQSFSLLSNQLSPSTWMGRSALALTLSLLFATGTLIYGAIKNESPEHGGSYHSGEVANRGEQR